MEKKNCFSQFCEEKKRGKICFKAIFQEIRICNLLSQQYNDGGKLRVKGIDKYPITSNKDGDSNRPEFRYFNLIIIQPYQSFFARLFKPEEEVTIPYTHTHANIRKKKRKP